MTLRVNRGAMEMRGIAGWLDEWLGARGGNGPTGGGRSGTSGHPWNQDSWLTASA